MHLPPLGGELTDQLAGAVALILGKEIVVPLPVSMGAKIHGAFIRYFCELHINVVVRWE